MKEKVSSRILITRTDRLGDVVLATPVLKELRKKYPDAELVFLVQKAWFPILQFGEKISLLEYDPNESMLELSKKLSAANFDRAYILKSENRVLQAVKKAGIPVRIGPYSSLQSFLYLNAGKFQKRSRCQMHEAEYNLDLVEPRQAAKNEDELPHAWIETSAEAKSKAEQYLTDHELKNKNFAVIHPGSSGSARYVKQAELLVLTKKISESGFKVCVSGGPLEDDLLAHFKAEVPNVILLGKSSGLGLDGMAEVYREASFVVAHGTGPLHLAAAVGTPTFAIFPPIFVLSEKRWGPLIAKRKVWVPPVPCPAKYRCLGQTCPYFDCMDRFAAERAFENLKEWMT